jgi:hypothetical protein
VDPSGRCPRRRGRTGHTCLTWNVTTTCPHKQQTPSAMDQGSLVLQITTACACAWCFSIGSLFPAQFTHRNLGGWTLGLASWLFVGVLRSRNCTQRGAVWAPASSPMPCNRHGTDNTYRCGNCSKSSKMKLYQKYPQGTFDMS